MKLPETLVGLSVRELGRHSIYLPQVDSTNLYLKENGESLPHGTLCYTGQQTAGRGRLGRSWIVPPGQSLAMSVLFKLDNINKLYYMDKLPLLCGVAVVQALVSLTGHPFQIKWPNDIVCSGFKVCGILCESRMTKEGGFAVAGIGINLSQPADFFEEAQLPHAASLQMLLPEPPPAFGETAAAVMNHLDSLWCLYDKEGFEPIYAPYEKMCMTIGKEVRILSPLGQAVMEGKAVGIGQDGSLLVQAADGTVHSVQAGEASVRGKDGYI